MLGHLWVVLAVHPTLSCAQRVASLHSQLVVEPPVFLPLEKVHLAVFPGERSIQVRWGSCEKAGDLPWMNGERAQAQFIPLPVASTLGEETEEE